jgi:hypothetical protein
VFSEELADEACEAACATSWRHRSMRWDLEGELLLMVVEGCHAVRRGLRCGRAMLEGMRVVLWIGEWVWSLGRAC